MVLLNAGAHSEHIKVIRRNIKPGSAERSREVENEMISKGKVALRFEL
jgi:hypothetical protein